MRAVFVNHCHPDMPHVCALRMSRFAVEMAKRGHEIVLLTETLTGQPEPVAPQELTDALAGHDWSEPFRLAVAPVFDATLERLRDGRLPNGVRQAVIAQRYFLESGLFGDWRKGARRFLGPLCRTFKPEIVWATFGNTDTWNIAADLAARSGCPWVADFKDNWEAFIPKPLRAIVARRYGDAAHMTTFSESHSAAASTWFGQEKTVIYSGFDARVFGTDDEPADTGDGTFRLLLTGSVYAGENLDALVAGIGIWLDGGGAGEGREVHLAYAGNDRTRFGEAAQALKGRCLLEIEGYLAIPELVRLQRRADANLYIRSPGVLFHHKILELLAAGRPVLCLPDETGEGRRIAESVGGTLVSCADATALADGLATATAEPPQPADGAKLARYTWTAQAEVLEAALRRAGGLA